MYYNYCSWRSESLITTILLTPQWACPWSVVTSNMRFGQSMTKVQPSIGLGVRWIILYIRLHFIYCIIFSNENFSSPRKAVWVMKRSKIHVILMCPLHFYHCEEDIVEVMFCLMTITWPDVSSLTVLAYEISYGYIDTLVTLHFGLIKAMIYMQCK